MRKNIKFLIGCAVLAGTGLILTAIGAAFGGMVNGIQLGTDGFHVSAAALQKEDGTDGYVKKQENLEAFDSIEIDAGYADINIKESDSGGYAVSCGSDAYMDFACEVKDGRLAVNQNHNHNTKGFRGISWFSFGSFTVSGRNDFFIDVYVPRDVKLSEVIVRADSGSFSCSQLQADSMKLTVEYGDVHLTDVKAGAVEASLNTGDLLMEQVQGNSCKIKNEYGNITMYSVTLSGDMALESDSGDIKWQDVAARDLVFESAYGQAKGRDISLRNAEAEMNSGNCELENIAFDNWNMKSEYGNVELKLARPLADYRYELETEYGSVTLDGAKMGESYRSVLQDKEKEKMIAVKCDSGNIDIR